MQLNESLLAAAGLFEMVSSFVPDVTVSLQGCQEQKRAAQVKPDCLYC